MYLLCEIKIAIVVAVEEIEHMKAFTLADVIDHVFPQEGDDVVGTDFVETHPVDSLERSPGLETMLLGELLSLLLDDFFVL